jgi:glycosyltransferase involved in cell wall biosynthesis
MKQPLVSVIVPTYNRTDYLEMTLKSVLSQTYKNIEIIVVDDGSEGDANKTLCDSFSNVIYIKIMNSGGPAKPRNTGIETAKGELIGFTDDDDIWLPQKLEKQVSTLVDHIEYGLVHGPCAVIDESGNKSNEIIGRPGSPLVKHGDVKLRMMGNWTLMMPTPLVRSKVIKQVGFFNEKIPPALEDVEFWVRCSFYTSFYYMDEPLVLYRKHANNISSDKKKYVRLPLYLSKVIAKQMEEGRINRNEAKILIASLCRMQAKMIKYDFLKTLINLFKLNPFWFLNFNHSKTLVKMLIS